MEIEIIKSLVKRFRKERTKENWCLLENFIVDKSFCITCNGSIFYPNSLIRISKGGNLKYDTNFPSCKSFKEVDGKKFSLSVCHDCLVIEFPEYNAFRKMVTKFQIILSFRSTNSQNMTLLEIWSKSADYSAFSSNKIPKYDAF
jgi:hypothetical protein